MRSAVPPGSAVTTYRRAGGSGAQPRKREYDGIASTQAETTWAIDRLRALGLRDFESQSEGYVVAACGQWTITIQAPFMPYGGPPSGPWERRQ
jgi:hypothetical protein